MNRMPEELGSAFHIYLQPNDLQRKGHDWGGERSRLPGDNCLQMEAAFRRPIFIMAPPRSGTTLLFDLLAQSPGVWTIGGESHRIIEAIPKLRPDARGWESNRLTAADADEETVRRLKEGFAFFMRDRGGTRPTRALRFLEKTPRNCLRLPFFASAFPDALFLYLYREPRETISSMLEAWRAGTFVSYPFLPDWTGPPWSLLLVPGGRTFPRNDLGEIAARQWAAATTCLLADLAQLPRQRWHVADFERLAREPRREIERLCAWTGIEWDREVTQPLPVTRSAVTPPAPEKWRRNAKQLERVMPLIAATVEQALAFARS